MRGPFAMTRRALRIVHIRDRTSGEPDQVTYLPTYLVLIGGMEVLFLSPILIQGHMNDRRWLVYEQASPKPRAKPQ